MLLPSIFPTSMGRKHNENKVRTIPIFLVGETAEKSFQQLPVPEVGVNFIGHLRALLHATWVQASGEFSGVFVVSNEKKGPKHVFFWG